MAGVVQEAVDETAELFQAAALGQVGWARPLEALGRLTGSTGGELIGLGGEALVPFNLMTGVPEETAADFEAAGGGDPAVNSRVRIGSRINELHVLDESAFTTASDMRRNPAYADWIHRYDMHNVCLTPLVKTPEKLVGLALLRSARQGNVSAEEKRAFAAGAAHARAAVRTHLALEAQGERLLAGAMEAVRAVAFFCDRGGRVHAMTATAEALVAEGDVLVLRGGQLSTACEADRAALDSALGAVLGGEAPSQVVIARRLGGDDRALIEVAPLPPSCAPGFDRRALVIVHSARPDAQRIAAAARALFGLSAAEAGVAAQLAAGRSPAAIAHERGVSLGTVRSQVRRIYEKAGVASQLELSARLPRL